MRSVPVLIHPLAVLLAFTTCSAGAQVLSALNAVPLVGDTFTTRQVDYGDVFGTGPAGVGVTWDFSDFVIEQDNYFTYASIDPTSAPLHAAYPESDVVIKSWPGPGMSAVQHDHYDNQDEGLYKSAYGGEAYMHDYDTLDLVQALPLYFGTEVNTPFCYTATGFDDPVHICGGTRQSVDGDGTLVLPYGTVPYTVRTQHQRYFVVDNASADTAFSTVHRWWAPELRWPVLEMITLTDTDGVEWHSVEVMDPAMVLGVEEREGARSRVYPIPFKDHLTIDVAPALLLAGLVHLRTADGRLVRSARVPGGVRMVTLDLGGSPAGPLFIEINTSVGRVIHKTVHQP